MVRRIFFVIVLLSALTSSVLGYFSYKSLVTPIDLHSDYLDFVIEPGSSFRYAASNLYKKKLIRSYFPILVYARISGKSSQIKAGEYRIHNGQTPLQILSLLIEGKSIQHAFTIVEGWNLDELLISLAREPKLNHVLEEPVREKVFKAISPEAQSLEGLFFADTYYYSRSDTELDLLKRAYKRMQSVLEREWRGRMEGLPYKSSYEALIMASIIEKETGLPEERPEIAGVFIRRLEKNMRLQTDPTVIYGLGKNFNGNLTRKHLRTKTPYNTYEIFGLPPTPIAMVGLDAIRASLHPAGGDDLYFVARGDGSHFFSATLKEHNRAVKKYQWKRRADYRSAPK